MAQPPAGSSLLFGALADTGRIKERKNGSYRMVLKGIDDIDWFTDRPDRVAGEWSPKKLVKKWDSLFGGVEPNAQATFEVGSKRKLVTFEMFKPKLSDSNQTLSWLHSNQGESGDLPVAAIAERTIDNPSASRSCIFCAGLNTTPHSLNSATTLPFSDPVLAKIASSAIAWISLGLVPQLS